MNLLSYIPDGRYLAISYNESIRQANIFIQQANDIDKMVREQRMKDEEAVRTKREYTTLKVDVGTVAERDGFRPWPGDPLPGMTFVRLYMVASDAYMLEQERLLRLYGSAPAFDRQVASLGYYRINDVLIGFGGGTIVLNTPCVCTDEQWARIIAGDVPTELLSQFYRS